MLGRKEGDVSQPGNLNTPAALFFLADSLSLIYKKIDLEGGFLCIIPHPVAPLIAARGRVEEDDMRLINVKTILRLIWDS